MSATCRVWVLCGLAACVAGDRPGAAPREAGEASLDVADRPPAGGYRAAYALTWEGARMGGAVESLEQVGGGLRFVRDERIVIRRGDLLVPYRTRITIDTDLDLRAAHVSVERRAGAADTRGAADRGPDGRWRAWFGDAPARVLPAHAVPAELVPLLVARSAERGFHGTAFLPGSAFAVAELAVRAADGEPRRPPRRVIAEVMTEVGDLRTTVELAADGTVDRVLGGDAVGAVRVDPATLEQPFDPPELVDGASIAVAGEPAGDGGDAELVVDTIWRDPPPPLPGQEIRATGGEWRVHLVPGDRGALPATEPAPPASDPALAALADRIVAAADARGAAAEVRALVGATAVMLDDDLGAPVTEASAALALGRGDCTAHATLFAALAAARGIATRLVTGYRLVGARLVRHRWALAAIDGRWVAVDPTFGEAPAAPRLLGLASHGASADELSLVDSIAFAGTSHARARIAGR